MSFLSPLFLFGALTVAVPLVLHLLKRQTEARVKFAAVQLLRHAPVEDTKRRRLRELLLLALRMAALVLLAVAFARPFFASGAARMSGGVTIVALDTSLSVSAPGQFERVRQLARQAVARAGSGDLVGVMTFSDTARILVRPTADRALASAAIEQAEPGFGATRYSAALNAANELIESNSASHGAIIVVTDLQASGWDVDSHAAVPDSVQIQVADIGQPPPNLAVVAARAQGDSIAALIRNTGSETREAHATLEIDGRPAGEGQVRVGPNQTAELTLAGGPGESARVTVDDPAGVAGDNARYLVLGGTSRSSLLVVTTNGDLSRDAFYLEQALAAGGPSLQVEGASGGALAAWDAARLNGHAAVVITSTKTLNPHGRELLNGYLKNRGGILVAAGPEVSGDVIREITDAAVAIDAVTADVGVRGTSRTLAPADIRHPILQAFGATAATLGLVHFRQIAAIGGRDCATLASFSTGEPAVADCSIGAGRVLVIASDFDNKGNDFPLHASFVPFVQEAVRYLSGGHPQGGEYLVGEAPAGVLPRPGIARIADPVSGASGAGGAGATRTVAINVDPNESLSERMTPEEFQAAITRVRDAVRPETQVETRQQENRQHIWEYLLALMIGMLVVESVVAARTA